MMGWAMTRFAPGSFGWLLFHELRLAMRGRRGRWSRTRITALIFFAILVAAGCLVAVALKDVPIPASPMAFAVALTAAIGLSSFMITQGMINAQRTLYERGDLDLLFSAPIAGRTVLLAKLCGIVGTIMLSYAILLLPFAIPVAAVNHPGLFGIPLVLVSLALVSACIGLAITLILARLAGPRAARTVGQVVAAILGGAMFILSQVLSHGDVRRRSGIMLLFERLQRNDFATHGIGSWPGRAAFGDPVAMIGLLGGAILILLATGVVFQRLFFRGFEDAGKHVGQTRASDRAIARHFRPTLFGAVFRKEFILLLRDPALAFQIVLRLVYLLPLLFVAFQGDHHLPLAPSLAFFSVAVAGQLAGSFAWLTVSAEDARDLITVAPVDKAEIDWIKLMTALTMTAPLAVLLPIAIATETLAGALLTLVMTGIAGILAGLLELKLGKPMPRKTFARRRSGSVVVGVLSLIVTVVFGSLTGAGVYLMM